MAMKCAKFNNNTLVDRIIVNIQNIYRQLITNKNLKCTYKSNEIAVYTYTDYMHNLYVWYICQKIKDNVKRK